MISRIDLIYLNVNIYGYKNYLSILTFLRDCSTNFFLGILGNPVRACQSSAFYKTFKDLMTFHEEFFSSSLVAFWRNTRKKNLLPFFTTGFSCAKKCSFCVASPLNFLAQLKGPRLTEARVVIPFLSFCQVITFFFLSFAPRMF